MSFEMQELSFEMFEIKAKEDPVFILPIGATEEHGRHLPLGSDTMQAVYTARAVAERVGGLVLPVIPFGVSTSLRDFPGTISVSFSSLHSIVKDILSELIRNGARKIVVISSHGAQAHMAAIRTACEEIAENSEVKIIALCDYEILYKL
ncbi:MAG: creatininase family protein, partial [Methanomassiliicoccales archaeon]